MNYKLTKQFLKGEEQLIAAFSDLNDAKIFAIKQSSINEVEGKKVLYRIYDDFELVDVTNEGKLTVTHSEDPETYSNSKFLFNVTIKPSNTEQRITIAYFKHKEDANLFVVAKCSTDTAQSIDLFFIFKDKLLIETLNKNIIDNKTLRSEGSGGNEKGATFRPTPMPSRPTPPGGPSDYWVDEDKDD